MTAVPLALFVVFVVVPAVEIWLFVQVGQEIGFGPAFLLIVVAAVLGIWVMRRASAATRETLRSARAGVAPDGAASADIGLRWLAGLLLVLPGFVTDVVGLALLVPPVRRLVRRLVGQSVARRVTVIRPPGWRGRGDLGTGDVIPGEIVRDDRPDDGPAGELGQR